jgi:hypothetical protein
MNEGHIVAVDNLIDRMGRPCRISTRYRLASDSAIGSTELELERCFGLKPGYSFTVGTELAKVSSVNILTGTITTESPLLESHIKGDSVSFIENTKLVPTIRGRYLSRDTMEFSRLVRMPFNTLIDYGSEVAYLNRFFLTTGYTTSDLSLYIELLECNGLVDIRREIQGNFNGFSYDQDETVIASKLPVYVEHISVANQQKDVGKTPNTLKVIILPKVYNVQTDDIIDLESYRLRVITVDSSRIPNMDSVYLGHDSTINRGGGDRV